MLQFPLALVVPCSPFGSQKPTLHSAGSESAESQVGHSGKQQGVAPTSARLRSGSCTPERITVDQQKPGGWRFEVQLVTLVRQPGLRLTGNPSKRERKTSRTRPRLPRTSKKIPLVRLRRTSAWTSPGIKFSACQHQLGVRCRPKKP